MFSKRVVNGRAALLMRMSSLPNPVSARDERLDHTLVFKIAGDGHAFAAQLTNCRVGASLVPHADRHRRLLEEARGHGTAETSRRTRHQRSASCKIL